MAKIPEAKIVSDAAKQKAYFVQGPVKFEIDPRDIFRTLGAASYAGNGILDNLSPDLVQDLLQINELPFKPFIRALAKIVLMRIVQRVWQERYGTWNEEFDLELLEKMDHRDQAARDEYIAKLASYKEEKEDRPATTRGREADSVEYEINWKPGSQKFTGQQELIAHYFEKHKVGSIQSIAMAIKDDLTTRQPAERVVHFYINDWKKKGLIKLA